MSLGKGLVYSTLMRQKLNTKSLTEAELVGVDDVMPLVLWTRYFLQVQGYEVCENKMFQDNKSMSCSKRMVSGPAAGGHDTLTFGIFS
jgi:hypothetical protein